MKSGSFGKWSLTLGVVLIAALGAGAAARKEKPAVTAAAGSWICPMYCNPATSQPGTCPTCGMALVLASTVPPPPANPERRVRSAAFVCSRGDGTEDIEAGVCAKCGAPMVPVFSYPRPAGRLLIRYGPPLKAERYGAIAEDILAITRQCTALLEAEIRRHPARRSTC